MMMMKMYRRLGHAGCAKLLIVPVECAHTLTSQYWDLSSYAVWNLL